MTLKANEDIPTFSSLGDLNEYLLHRGCCRCNLGIQTNINGCCVSRGSLTSKLMIIGEGPGRDEDKERNTFVGPAGQLLDRIWRSVGLDTNDWYLTNTILCRPVAPLESRKQNLSPTTEQKKQCRPLLMQQIQLLNPEIIVSLGVHATSVLLNKTVRIGEYRGKLTKSGRFLIYPMLHPSCILQSKGDTDRYNMYRQQMWSDIRKLKEILTGRNLI